MVVAAGQLTRASSCANAPSLKASVRRPAMGAIRLTRLRPARGTVKCPVANNQVHADEPNDLEVCSVDDATSVFYDHNGEAMQVLACDYGFRTGSSRLYQEQYGNIPTSVVDLAKESFAKEWKALVQLVTRSGREHEACSEIRQKLNLLTLDDAAVIAREKARDETHGVIKSPVLVKAAYKFLCWSLDLIYANRPIQRFWVLEVVARMPYFAYISCLHFYESMAWWRAGAELRKVHFAEEWNELIHCQIMESLGGDRSWFDRFIAQHSALVYFWVLVGIFFISPPAAYNFMELVENHAADTYGQFAAENEKLLKTLPPPLPALSYYRSADLYYFDMFQTGRPTSPRRPECRNLYDVFINIRDDEGEHVKTMVACQDNSIATKLRDINDHPMNHLASATQPPPPGALPHLNPANNIVSKPEVVISERDSVAR